MRPEDILVPTPAGVCCKLGGFHIDPTRPVERALITHGHSDHARAGHGAVLATQETLDHHAAALRREFRRVDARRSAMARALKLGGVKVTFHPAGHVLGSAQICRRSRTACASSRPATTRTCPTRPARRSSWCSATCSSPRRPLALPVFRHGDPDERNREAAATRSHCFPSARIWSAPIRSARRSASSR